MPNQPTLDGIPPAPEPDEETHRRPGDYPARLLDMHQVYGHSSGNRCGKCGHFERYRQGGNWAKCGKSKKTASSATDWRGSWPACGQFVEQY